MPHRRAIVGTAGLVFHVINRGVRRSRLFDQDADYQSCLTLLSAACERIPLRLLAYCLMPNHFHLVTWPDRDGQLSAFMQWFTATHSKRWHLCRGTTGTGSVYQGRFKAFPVQSDKHFLTVCRYVERNALRAGLVRRAEDWPWSSLAQRLRNCNSVPLEAWPVLQPDCWIDLLNEPEPASEVQRVRRSIVRGAPYGESAWAKRIERDLDLASTTRERGRPRKMTSEVFLRNA